MKTFRSGVLPVAALLAVVVFGSAMGPGSRNATMPREVTLMGTIVDLHGFMTETFASADHAKCMQDCIRAGVPAGLETEDGLVIIGEGSKGPARTIAMLAMKHVELKGKLFERNGVRYVDMASVKEIMVDEQDDQWSDDDQPGDDDAPDDDDE